MSDLAGEDVAQRALATLRGRLLAVLFCIFVAAPLAYAAYTHHVWEDYLITFRHSENLVEGQGLVYYPGERVHGFTSPLGVLVPAVLYAASGKSFAAALWGFRVLSAVAFGVAGVLFVRMVVERTEPARELAIGAGRRGAGRAAGVGVGMVAAGALFLGDAKGLIFSANGQETALMLVFLAWAVFVAAGARLAERWWAVGLALAGLQWTRPDGAVYAAGVMLAALVWTPLPRRTAAVALAKASLLAGALYLPWVVFAWGYYGSPVPNTIPAKAAVGAVWRRAEGMSVAEWYVRHLLSNARGVFLPVYPGFEGWPAWVDWVSWPLMGVSAGAWAVRAWPRVARFASVCYCVMAAYVGMMPVLYPWYAPPVAMLGYVVVGSVLLEGLRRGAAVRLGAVLCVGVVLAFQYYIVAESVREMKFQQAEVEDGVRTKVGQWLYANARRTDTVYLEPLGYIGYYSRCHMLDYPGLVAPRVAAVVREHGCDLVQGIAYLKPDWVVLRPREIVKAERNVYFVEHYRRAHAISNQATVDAHFDDFRGILYIRFDAAFGIYRRVDAAPAGQ